MIPTPGTRRIRNLDVNLRSLDVHLTKAHLAEIDAVFPANAATGLRYPALMMGFVGR